jgi:hypothetical protein
MDIVAARSGVECKMLCSWAKKQRKERAHLKLNINSLQLPFKKLMD